MESRERLNKSHFSKKLTKTQKKSIQLITLLTLSAILVSFLQNNSHTDTTHHHQPTLSLSSPILESSINLTVVHVKKARIDITARSETRDLNPQQKNALQDCMEMLDQTLYELQQAIHELGRASSANINTLLSAAMTNENTCINGFLDLQELGLDSPMGHIEYLRNLLGPISHMISNTLAHVEKKKRLQKPKMMMMMKNVRIVRRRRRKQTTSYSRPYVTVASDGSGNFTSIGEAIAMAPNKSSIIHVIKIKSGMYRENVVIPREKINIMLIGDAINRTIITGSRNFVDGFSTFESATLTVIGDKFMARDLTIENTSPPEKHQAVAMRVTSNAAFSRCEIKSNQDTLYAHSLRQFYHDCVIQGTIDFIFGNAAAVFQNCTILVRKPIRGQRNTITAQGRDDPNQNTGIILHKCTIEGAREFDERERKKFATYLGRPWRSYSRTVVVDSYLGDLVHPRGWLEWAVYSSGDTVEYIECRNSGPGSDTRRRVAWGGYSRNCSEDVVKRFRVEEFLHGPDEWLESTVLPLFAASK